MNELANISERAAEKSLPCLLAGGHAVITHGFARSTFDLDLIAELIQIHGLDPEAEAIRELFRQHGTEEFYEKVRTACRRA